MKKLFFAMVLSCCYFLGTAQVKITAEEALAITANTMANFTESVSFAYYKGATLKSFKIKLLSGNSTIPEAGNGMIETAYSYLSKGLTKDQIVHQNDGKAVAAALRFLFEQHSRGLQPDGSDIFGIVDIPENSYEAKKMQVANGTSSGVMYRYLQIGSFLIGPQFKSFLNIYFHNHK